MPDRPSIILATSNGTGMGHLARQLAVGMAGAAEAQITLFSFSMALPVVTTETITGEYCPGPDRGWIPAHSWDRYVADRLAALAREVGADVIAFDGVAPYRGVTLAKRQVPDAAFVWLRRGLWREGVNRSQLWKSSLFDLIIEPGDLASSGDRGPTADRDDAVRVPPIGLLEVVERLPREQAAEALGLDPHRPILLLTLGSGRIGEVAEPGAVVIEETLRKPRWQVCVVTSAIARLQIPADAADRVRPVSGVFPLVRYLDAFDAAVSAAGYNAVHELIPAGIPTLFLPNTMTRTDDQEARARVVAERGIAIAAGDKGLGLREGVARLLQEDTLSELRHQIARLERSEMTGGARAAFDRLSQLAAEYTPAPPTWPERVAGWRDDAKQRLKELIGVEGTNLVRKVLGRPPIADAGRLEVVLDSEKPPPGTRRLWLTSEIDVSRLSGDDPVEQLLPGSSASYQTTRRLIIDRYYEVVSPR
ncbi:MAG: UDP-N-acetylglucosamine--LPS N-acetylglucosamine transferase [Actinobacteria bacterium]|nr:UDP-N-acetylglucosamine--LPS N-acetylglucosamine transferase [Actinomycetota bacterium]